MQPEYFSERDWKFRAWMKIIYIQNLIYTVSFFLPEFLLCRNNLFSSNCVNHQQFLLAGNVLMLPLTLSCGKRGSSWIASPSCLEGSEPILFLSDGCLIPVAAPCCGQRGSFRPPGRLPAGRAAAEFLSCVWFLFQGTHQNVLPVHSFSGIHLSLSVSISENALQWA